MQNLNVLRKLYILAFVAIALLIVFTPLIVSDRILFVEEETAEIIIIFFLFIAGYSIYRFFGRELEKKNQALAVLEKEKGSLEERLDEAFKHIGKVNILVQEIEDIFSQIDKYPENKNDIKRVFDYLAKKVLGIINVEWVILRIVDLSNFNTLREYCDSRGSTLLLKHQIHNKDLLEMPENDYSVIKSDQQNLKIKAFCIFPKKEISNEQEVIIKVIVSQLEMLFLIYSSFYFKNKVQ